MFVKEKPDRKQISFLPKNPREMKLSLEEHGNVRSRRPEVFCKNLFLEISQNSQEKHLCYRLFFNKFTGLRAATLLKKRLWKTCFPVDFAKFLKTPFVTEHLWTMASDNYY